jgi:signal transduction histidine kinase
MDVLAELAMAAPLALLFSLPVALVGGLLLEWMRRRSIIAAMTALVLVPVTAALVGVLGVSGFMYTPQLVGTIVVCLVVAAVTVPAGLLLGRRVAREALWQREARETERRMEASRQELVAGMSHDLRSPLAGILGMADALVDGVVHEPHEVKIYLGRIRRETVRMTTMVEDLFELSRAKSGAMQLRTTRLALGEVCSDAVAAEAVAAASAGVSVVATDPQLWPTVLGSDTELTRVVRNLLSNGVRHTPAGGVVRLPPRCVTARRSSPCRTAAAASPPTSCPGSSTSDSVAPAPAPPATTSGPVWAWRSPGRWSRPSTAGSR